MKSSHEIIEELTFIQSIISEKQCLAHRPFCDEDKKNESLVDHSRLVVRYLDKLIDIHSLDKIIDGLISDIIPKGNDESLPLLLKKMFFESIYLHDLGKVNPNFQRLKMEVNTCHTMNLSFKSNHSLPGLFLFLNYSFDNICNHKLDEGTEDILIVFSFILGFQIAKHHSPTLSSFKDYISCKFDFYDEDVKLYYDDIMKMKNYFNVNIREELNFDDITSIIQITKDFIESNNIDHFSLFALMKLHFSLLTASDYLATGHYMNNWKGDLLCDFGTIDTKLKDKIIRNIRTSKSYNKAIYDNLNNFEFTRPTKPCNKNLNILRQELAVELIHNIRKFKNDKVFYIEAPTGGGKTNLSLIALAELMENNFVKNIYYVFPFTTLITQTYKVLVDTLGLDEDEIVELHSKAGFPEKSDGDYARDKKNNIDYMFVNYPIALLSHVKFFDILKTNRKEQNYILHRLANSVVIIDELQSYNPKDWNKIIYFIDNYANKFNIRFILMSATLPKIGDLSNVKSEVKYLINNKNDYFQNPNFSKRVMFDFSLLDWKTPNANTKEEYLIKLSSKLLYESTSYCINNTTYPDSVFTIIEFIYKQTATDFYKIIEEAHDGFFDHIFLLSGSILEYRRKEIIYFLKNENNRNSKVLLISTQVVEAGVDIDMDLGFKDQSLIDSDEQLAGRINRNVNKSLCKLFIFNCDKASVIYGKDKRFNLMEKEFYEDYKSILENKDFDYLYKEVMLRLDKDTNRSMTKGFDDYLSLITSLDFTSIDSEFKIINQQNQTVFVPIKIPVFVGGTNDEERNFSLKDIYFLKENNIIIDDGYIDGERVFDLYKDFILKPNPDFIDKKIKMKKLQGIISQFVFSVMTQSKDNRLIRENAYGEDVYGFFLLSHWKSLDCYDPKYGLSIKDESFCFI